MGLLLVLSLFYTPAAATTQQADLSDAQVEQKLLKCVVAWFSTILDIGITRELCFDGEPDAVAVRAFSASGFAILRFQFFLQGFLPFGERVGALSIITANRKSLARPYANLSASSQLLKPQFMAALWFLLFFPPELRQMWKPNSRACVTVSALCERV